ncbi:MAG: DUF4364 family protein [Faecalibacterium sp.]
MMANNAFTAGVKPGGLTSNTEIRLLLCYLIQNVAGLTLAEIETALVEEELVNFFEVASAMDDILQQELAHKDAEAYYITEKGAKVAAALAYDLPRSVREAAIAAAIRKQTWNKKSAEYHAEIKELPDGQFLVTCTITSISTEAFCLTLTMPDSLTAQHIHDQFILQGSEIYALLLNKLTELPAQS